MCETVPDRKKIIERLRDLPIGERGEELGYCCGRGCIDCEFWSSTYELKLVKNISQNVLTESVKVV